MKNRPFLKRLLGGISFVAIAVVAAVTYANSVSTTGIGQGA